MYTAPFAKASLLLRSVRCLKYLTDNTQGSKGEDVTFAPPEGVDTALWSSGGQSAIAVTTNESQNEFKRSADS